MKKIVPKLSMSKNHKRNYRIVKHPTLKQILTNNYNAVRFRDNTRLKNNVLEFFGNIIIDLDGNRDEYVILTYALRAKNISFVALPTPSHRDGVKVGQYRMRVIVRAKKLLVNHYGYQYRQFFKDIGINLDKHPGIDKSSGDIARYYYPPVMGAGRAGIKEPKTLNKVTGVWYVKKPKPRNIDMKYALKRVEKFEGKPYIAKTRFTKKEKLELIPPPTPPGNSKGIDKTSGKHIIHIPKDRVIKTENGSIKFSKLSKHCIKHGVQIRCNCPFEAYEHGDGEGVDYAWCNSSGILLCGSEDHNGRHSHLMGIVEPFGIEKGSVW